MSALPPKADMDQHGRDVCQESETDIVLKEANEKKVVESLRQRA